VHQAVRAHHLGHCLLQQHHPDDGLLWLPVKILIMLVYGDVIIHQDLHPLLDPPVDCQFQTIKPTSQQMLNFAAIDSLSCALNHHLPNWKYLLHNMTSLHELFHGQHKACLCFTFLPLIVGMPTHIHYTV
jgi:hypothetical protein